MLDLRDHERDILVHILGFYLPTYKAYVFGSRALGRARKFSDLDVALVGPGPIPCGQLTTVREALSLSDLPIFVDLVDMQAVSEQFRAQVAGQMQPLI